MSNDNQASKPDQYVTLSISNGVAELVLNRPDKSNAFDASMISDLFEALRKIENDVEIRVVVLSGKGKHFSAGADLNWMRSMAEATYQENLEDARVLAILMDALYRCSKPTIARVQGSAFGGALGLICCCDIAIGASNSQFCLSEVKLGLVPAVISPYVNKCIGTRAMRRYTLTAELIDAAKACQIGILSEVVAPDCLDDHIAYLCQQLRNNSPTALTSAKSLLTLIQNTSIDEANQNYTSELIAKLRVSKEGQQGITAFLEKTTPPWITNKPKEGQK